MKPSYVIIGLLAVFLIGGGFYLVYHLMTKTSETIAAGGTGPVSAPVVTSSGSGSTVSGSTLSSVSSGIGNTGAYVGGLFGLKGPITGTVLK